MCAGLGKLHSLFTPWDEREMCGILLLHLYLISLGTSPTPRSNKYIWLILKFQLPYIRVGKRAMPSKHSQIVLLSARCFVRPVDIRSSVAAPSLPLIAWFVQPIARQVVSIKHYQHIPSAMWTVQRSSAWSLQYRLFKLKAKESWWDGVPLMFGWESL